MTPRMFALVLATASVISSPAFARQEQPATPAPAAPTAPAVPTAPAAPAVPEAPAVPLVPAAPAQATISPEAQLQLDKLSAAYTALKGFSTTGSFAANLDLGGQVQNEATDFTAIYASPMKFRHEVKGQILLGNTGEKVYAFKSDDKQYVQSDAPSEKAASSKLPVPLPQILRTQNPLLLLALTQDPVAELVRGATSVTRAADTDIGGTPNPTLLIESSDGTSVAVVTDAGTNLIRRMTIDLKKVFEARGAPDVKKAELVIDYKDTVLGDQAGTDFAWAPPEGATDAAAQVAPEAAPQGAPEGDAAALENQPAPDFSLPNEAGVDVKLSDLRGSVVVLDFWATWCPPCREGLPMLDKLASERADKPLKILAVNLGETKDVVADFKAQTSLGLAVLFDPDSKVGGLYKVSGIPQTVVIDKEGVVRRVIIGFNPAEKDALAKLIDELLAK